MEHLVEKDRCASAAVLERDEELLRAGRPVVRVGRFADGAVSLGVAQRSIGDLEARAHNFGLSIVRRPSGGTSLLHLPGDVFWSVVLPRGHPLARSGYVHRYAELGAGWVEFLRPRGVEATWASPPRTREDYCLLSSRGKALLAGPRALGGASQHVTHRALLHHGFVPASLRPDLLARLFDLPSATIEEGLTSLGDVGVPIEARELEELAASLERGLGEP